MSVESEKSGVARALEVIAAYGADPARWPTADHAAMTPDVLGAPSVRAALEDAAAIDAALDGSALAFDAPIPDAAFKARLVAAAPVAAKASVAQVAAVKSQPSWLSQLLRLPLAPAGALAVAAIAGFVVGGLPVATATSYEPEAEFVAFAENLLEFDADIDGANVEGETL